MLLALLLLQQPPASPPVARVEVTPAEASLTVGEQLQLRARALDAQGREVPGARVQWFAGGGEGTVDSTGLVTAGYAGYVRVVAVAGVRGAPPAVGEVTIRVAPRGAARVAVTPAITRLLAGTRLTLLGQAYSADGDARDDAVTWSSSNRAVVTVTPEGRLTAVAPGSATLTATAGAARSTFPVTVVANTVARLQLDPDRRTVRTGDVVRFAARALTRTGAPVGSFPVRWAVAGAGAEQVAQVDAEGAFVAETPGTYTVTATVGTQSADAVVRVTPRRVGRGLEVVGRVPLKFEATEVWPHPSGRCVYQATLADRVYAIDVTGAPRIVDSMLVDARIVNDVMTTEDGRYGVFSREGASSRKNGIVIFDAGDPCHPRVIAEYTETVSGGVHSSFVYQGHVYLTDDATGSMRVIDIRAPTAPREVGRFQTAQTSAGRYLHDVDVKDGLAYLSYWNDGLVIVDVGNGIKGGSPSRPVLVSQLKYDLNATYARVDQYYGLGARGTHTAWRAGRYVFVGDEVYAAKAAKGHDGGNDLTWGRLHVIDVADLERPRLVAWYEPTDAGVHNIWVEGDTLYMGSYQGGARVLDVSGELKGDLLRQGREMAWLFTADSAGVKPRATFSWGAVVQRGNIYVPDINTGLWILRLEPKRPEAPTP